MLLGVVVQSLKPVKLADGHNVQTDTTTLNIVGPTTLGVVASFARTLTEKDNFFCRCYSGHWWNRCKSGNDLYAFAFFVLLLYEHCLNFGFYCILSVFQKRETLDTRGLHYGMASAQFCRFVMKIQNHLSFILQLGGHLKFIMPLKTELQNIVNTFLSRRKLKEDKEEIEEQRRLRQEEEERSLVTVGSQFIL